MIKVYTQQKPQVVMEESKGFAHFTGELEAVENNGLIDIIRPMHGNETIEKNRPHTEFGDAEGNSFGTLQETIDALNDSFTEESGFLDEAGVNALIAISLLSFTGGSSPSSYSVHFSGRAYLNTNNSWSTNSDDNYGPSYFQFAETCGTGVDPIYEWEHNGHLVTAGQTLDTVHLAGRVTATTFTDVEIIIAKRVASYDNITTGFDNDSESVNTVLYRGFWKKGLIPLADKVWHKFEINHTFDEDCEIGIYYRPIGVCTSIDYLLHSIRYDFTNN